MANDLIPDPSVLGYLPGAPFTQAEVDAAVATIRKAVGWHIAPERVDMVTLDVKCRQRWLGLPTRKLVTVNEVRDTDGPEVIPPADYSVSRKLAQVEYDRPCAYWPEGYEAVEVDMTHGYESCPLDLYAVIAEAANLARRDQLAGQLTSGPFNVSFSGQTPSATNPLGTSSILDDYTLWFPLGIA